MRKFIRLFSKKRTMHFEHTSSGGGWFFDVEKKLQSAKTQWQKIDVVKTKEFGKALLLDGITQLTEAQEYQYHEPMAHVPLLAHKNPKKALVIGGGDGALAQEILRHPSIESLDFVELDEGVINFCKKHLPELGGDAFNDERVKLHIQDGRAFVENAEKEGKTYDAIFMDMTDPEGPCIALYTKEFFEIVSSLLKDDEAFFIMHAESPDLRLKTFQRIMHTLKAVFPSVQEMVSHVRMYGGMWTWAIASKSFNPKNFDAKKIPAVIEKRGLKNLKIISSETWESFFRLWPVYKALLDEEGEIATDANPGYAME